MQLAIFGLTITSSWGNGHATLWRGLCRALAQRGHQVTFFERDVPYYAAQRDLWSLDGVEIVLYSDWPSIRARAASVAAAADVAMVTSYCPDAREAEQLVVDSARLAVFYDMDTPVTLHRLRRGDPVAYIGPRGLLDYDLVLSYAGGSALDDLVHSLGARRVAPLYGSVDPAIHHPVSSEPQYEADLSYLGTYAADRQERLERLFIEPARQTPERRFVLGGAQYPEAFPWSSNIFFVRHLPPAEHPAFFCSSPLTLNVTRAAFAAVGYCPSGRLFEAAACGTAILSDVWDGLGGFFEPDTEIVCAHDTGEALAALRLDRAELKRIGAAARERVLRDHTAAQRAAELEHLLEDALRPRQRRAVSAAADSRTHTSRPSTAAETSVAAEL